MRKPLFSLVLLALVAAMSCAPETPPPPASASAAIPPGAEAEFRNNISRAE